MVNIPPLLTKRTNHLKLLNRTSKRYWHKALKINVVTVISAHILDINSFLTFLSYPVIYASKINITI